MSPRPVTHPAALVRPAARVRRLGHRVVRRLVPAALRPAAKRAAQRVRREPTYAETYLKDLYANGIPRREVEQWFGLSLNSQPLTIAAAALADYYKAGFTPETAESWVTAPVVTPAPCHAFQLHCRGWTGGDYLLVRDAFPKAWASAAFMSGQTWRDEQGGEQLLGWLRCSLPVDVVIRYVQAGITLDEALRTWEAQRAADVAEWDRSVQFLEAFRRDPLTA